MDCKGSKIQTRIPFCCCSLKTRKGSRIIHQNKQKHRDDLSFHSHTFLYLPRSYQLSKLHKLPLPWKKWKIPISHFFQTPNQPGTYAFKGFIPRFSHHLVTPLLPLTGRFLSRVPYLLQGTGKVFGVNQVPHVVQVEPIIGLPLRGFRQRRHCSEQRVYGNDRRWKFFFAGVG